MTAARHHGDRTAPIGVFDSGIGGLSVLRALRAALPYEQFVYVADSAHTPYGERGDDFIADRTIAIAHHLRDVHRAKLLVMACNTASAAAAHLVRQANPGWPVVAIEPALKPAAQYTRSGRVGVLATRSTLASRKFADLRQAMAEHAPAVRFMEMPCDGLAASIEQWALGGNGDASRALLARYLAALGLPGQPPDAIDTLVLGCTHYPLIGAQIARLAPAGMRLIDAGLPVARHAQRLLHATGLLHPAPAQTAPPPNPLLLATGPTRTLQAAAQRWLPATGGRPPNVLALPL